MSARARSCRDDALVEGCPSESEHSEEAFSVDTIREAMQQSNGEREAIIESGCRKWRPNVRKTSELRAHQADG